MALEAQGYDKHVEALRHLSTGRCDDSRKCELCAIYETCLTRCVLDAADAIEALQAEIRESMQRCAECGDELAHQMPKRGEWKITTEKFTPELICSKCNVHIPCVAGWCMDAHMNYCPNCGAKMFASDTNVLNKNDTTDGPIITPCLGCSDYDGYGGCKSKGGCARKKMEVQDA